MRAYTLIALLYGSIVGYPLFAWAAGAPPDPQNRLATGEFTINRCPGTGMLDPARCKLSAQMAFDGGAINATELKWAEDNGFAINVDARQQPWTLSAACPCSCLERGTRVLASTAGSKKSKFWIAVENLSPEHKLASVSSQATLSNFTLDQKAIRYVTHGPEEPKIIDLEFSGGQRVAVTQKHALLLADGTVVAAENLRLDQQVLDSTGRPTTIIRITRRPAEGDVYNFLLDTNEKKGHFAVAEGVIVGDLMWQNTLMDEVGSVVLRQ